MEVNVKKIDKLKHKLDIKLTGKEFTDKKDKFYDQASKKLKVPGFRPGKAPLNLIKKHHEKTLKDEFIKQHLPVIYQQALEQSEITPAGLPQVSDIKITDQALSFVAELEIQPKIEIKESTYKGIKIKDQKTSPDSKQVEEMIKKFKEEVKKITKKEFDDQKLAKWASYPDMNSFKDAINTQLHLDSLQKRRQNIDNQIKTHLLKSIKVEVPKAEIERYHKQLVDRQMQQLQQQGVKQQDLEKYKADFEKKLEPMAEDEVKFFYILRAIAKKEKIKEDRGMAEAVLGLILSEANFK
ncbi:MAG: trigger factor family protein [Candidatus Omnitrophota bacterium]